MAVPRGYPKLRAQASRGPGAKILRKSLGRLVDIAQTAEQARRLNESSSVVNSLGSVIGYGQTAVRTLHTRSWALETHGSIWRYDRIALGCNGH